GIRVRMITGDYAVTAAAVAGQLGIDGKAITGAEFGAMTDEEALAKVDGIGVIARVTPEHKVRLVDVLRKQGQIVAMTGDGFNVAEGIPLLPLQTLWVSFTMLSIQSVGLGYSKPAAGLMERPPLPPSRPILTRALIVWLALVGLLMTIGTLSVISGAEQVHGL